MMLGGLRRWGRIRSFSSTGYKIKQLDTFPRRHLGINKTELNNMVTQMGYRDVDHLLENVLPNQIRFDKSNTNDFNNKIPQIGHGETKALKEIEKIAKLNNIGPKNGIGMGYYDTITPPVIQRMILENPNWYTPYTPYQAEISQGRMESLFTFQTMIGDLTGLTYANASLLDEATACVEAMMLSYNYVKGTGKVYLVDQNCHPQNLLVLQGRAEQLGIKLWLVDGVEGALKWIKEEKKNEEGVFGCLIQYPNTFGTVYDYRLMQELSEIIPKVGLGGLTSVVCDPMALVLLKSPGELGADIALGSTQRFGVPMGGGGPHPAFFAVRSGTTDRGEKENTLVRLMPGRMIGMSKGSFRLTLQTREQHIKREKANSNICTAQALLANVAANYAVYHGPDGLKNISQKIHDLTKLLVYYLHNENTNETGKFTVLNIDGGFFDTVHVKYYFTYLLKNEGVGGLATKYNLRFLKDDEFTISIDETWKLGDVLDLVSHLLSVNIHKKGSIVYDGESMKQIGLKEDMLRTDAILTSEVFHKYHTETEMMRYLDHLQSKDLGLTDGAIFLGSCSMKLNAVAEMMPISWPEFSKIHPYAPLDQLEGYQIIGKTLKTWLSEITGFADVTLQPISGALGEYTGLVVISNYLRYRDGNGDGNGVRDICLIPDSAHGTNPASAKLAGFKVVTVKSDKYGNVDFDHLEKLVEKHRDQVGCLMITYPSTFGVFEDKIMDICQLIHNAGGQVYMDGANMNAQVGLTSPGFIGADVCHLNLHKTFCIPHGGGGPGMGPIGVAEHLVPFLPVEISYNMIDHGDIVEIVKKQKASALAEFVRDREKESGQRGVWPVSGSSFFGSGMILPIPYQYISMMGREGLLNATKGAIVAANYMKYRLMGNYPILYTNEHGGVAHEFILDVRKEQKRIGVTVMDIAKRLQDFGLHAGTCSWPVPGIMMLEPTESESKEEIDRYCEALLKIKNEMEYIHWELGELSKRDDKKGMKELKENNILKNAPHTIDMILDSNWDQKYTYSREEAVYPLGKKWGARKHWPTVSRLDDGWGDKNLIVNWHMVKDH